MSATTPVGWGQNPRPTGNSPVLELRNASKAFGHVVALNEVNLSVNAGEVLAVVGDNGAGKSTLVKIISGVLRPDSGDLLVHGKRISPGHPGEARAQGISTVFQDLALVETLDVATNMFLGRQISRWGVFANRRRMIAEAERTLRTYQGNVPSVRVAVGELSGGQRQSVAIARAVREDNPIVLMDEPTAALGVQETARVGAIINSLRAEGKAVVVVSHDMGFVFEHCDRIQVMRLGRSRATRDVQRTDREEIIGLITGAIQGNPPTGTTDGGAS